jgi:hypothetical protein
MVRKRYKAEEIVAKLRQVDVLTSQGQGMADAIRHLLSLWTALPLQDDFDLICLASCMGPLRSVS